MGVRVEGWRGSLSSCERTVFNGCHTLWASTGTTTASMCSSGIHVLTYVDVQTVTHTHESNTQKSYMADNGICKMLLSRSKFTGIRLQKSEAEEAVTLNLFFTFSGHDDAYYGLMSEKGGPTGFPFTLKLIVEKTTLVLKVC